MKCHSEKHNGRPLHSAARTVDLPAVSVVAEQAAHQGGHRSEVKRFLAEHLLEDVDSVPVLSIPGILLKLLHVLPVLQRQADLRTWRADGSEEECSDRGAAAPT